MLQLTVRCHIYCVVNIANKPARSARTVRSTQATMMNDNDSHSQQQQWLPFHHITLRQHISQRQMTNDSPFHHDDSPFTTSPYDKTPHNNKWQQLPFHHNDSPFTTPPCNDRHNDNFPFTTSTYENFLSQIPFLHYLTTYDNLFPSPHDLFPYWCNEKAAPPKAYSRSSRMVTCLTQAPLLADVAATYPCSSETASRPP